MKKFTLRINDETYEKIEAYRIKKGHERAVDSIRELLILALKINETASKLEGKNEEDSIEKSLDELKKFMKKNSEWVLENRSLTRFLVEKLGKGEDKNIIGLLDEYKIRAENYIHNLWDGTKK